MELLNLTVPQDMCALDFLAEMKERTKNAWIYLHANVINKLLKSDGVKCKKGINNCHILSWEATDEYTSTQVVISFFEAKCWYTVIAIDAEDIAFKEIDNIEEPEFNSFKDGYIKLDILVGNEVGAIYMTIFCSTSFIILFSIL